MQAVTDFQRDHGHGISSWISTETEALLNAAKRQVDRDTTGAQRDKARPLREQTRQRYQGLTRTELSDKLAERDLPKTGTVDELVDRLVTADTNERSTGKGAGLC